MHHPLPTHPPRTTISATATVFRLEAFISLVIASYIKVVRSLYCLGRADKAPACWMTDNIIQSLTNSTGFLNALINYRRKIEAVLCHNAEENNL